MPLEDIVRILISVTAGISFVMWAVYLSLFFHSLNPKINLPKDYLNRVYFMVIVFSDIMVFLIGYAFELRFRYFVFSVIKYLSLSSIFFLVPLSFRFLKGFLHSHEKIILMVYFIIGLFAFLSLLGEPVGISNKVINITLAMLTITFVFELFHFYKTRNKEIIPYEIFVFLPSLTIFEALKHIFSDRFGTTMGIVIDLFVTSYLLLLGIVSVVYVIMLSLDNYRSHEKSLAYLSERMKNEEKLYRWFVILLVSLIEARDSYTRSHSERVARYSYNLAKLVYKNTYMPNFIEFSAFLHDIGKLGVRDEVLFYPGKLPNDYYEEMKKHPAIGKELLDSVGLFKDLSDIAYMHHERIDGLGYPRGLKGNEIPLYVKISSIGDSFDAMNSSRVYRNKLDVNEIIRELKEGAGKQFDKKLVEVFIKNINYII